MYQCSLAGITPSRGIDINVHVHVIVGSISVSLRSCACACVGLYMPRFICANPNLTMAWIFAVRCLLLTACALGAHFRGAVFMVRPSPGGGENEVSGG